MKNLPEHLKIIKDQVIDHVISGLPPPENLIELVSWFEDDGWDEILSGWGSEHVALKLNDLAYLKFDDKEMIASEGIDEPLTDTLRLDYARRLISDAFENSDGYDCPSIHAVEIKKTNGDSAVLGWVIEIHGQGGPVACFMGEFADKENFYHIFSTLGFLLDTEEQNLTDESILNLWTKPIRSVVVRVEWGNEQHECPMSEQTWKRIIKGKPVRRVEPYWYDGKKYKSEWLFNLKEVGQLTVNYDDSGVAFDGKLNEAYITRNNDETTWLKERQKLNML